jgi:hypothetical protein
VKVATLYFVLVFSFDPTRVQNIFDNFEVCAKIADSFNGIHIPTACIPTTYDNVRDSERQLEQLEIILDGLTIRDEQKTIRFKHQDRLP